jgi:hypothetical protein
MQYIRLFFVKVNRTSWYSHVLTSPRNPPSPAVPSAADEVWELIGMQVYSLFKLAALPLWSQLDVCCGRPRRSSIDICRSRCVGMWRRPLASDQWASSRWFKAHVRTRTYVGKRFMDVRTRQRLGCEWMVRRAFPPPRQPPSGIDRSIGNSRQPARFTCPPHFCFTWRV